MNLEKLHTDWLKLGQKHCDDLLFLHAIWKKIEQNYSKKNRYYHTLNHIQSMLKQANENKSEIIYFDEVLLAIWFHDIIYKSSSKKNEEKSAIFANTVLKKFNLDEFKVERIYQLIVSTKVHKIIINDNLDNSFLLDFDLSILGQDWDVYKNYIRSIRKEYKIYPDFLYNSGRKKVLEGFLNREKLYFTKKYQNLFEEKARENLKRELKLLN